MIKNITIICGGSDYDEQKIIKSCNGTDYIIAADGAMNLLSKLKITPNILLGDMDSIKEEILQECINIKQEVYPRDKDYTDSELAIIRAISLNPKNIEIHAATGDYLDHSLGNVLNLFKYQNEKIIIKIITKNSEIFPVIKECRVKGRKGRRFSLIPFGEIKGIKLIGAKYNFKKNNLKPVDYSVSNVISENELVIKVKKGLLICILFDKMFN